MITYGFTIKQTRFDGSSSNYGATGYESEEAADADKYRFAKAMGWTPRKWWQWWRWHDTPNIPEVRGKLA